MNAHVAIIMGGTSAEREVSIVTGKAVEEALVSVGYKVTTIDAIIRRKIEYVLLIIIK